MVGNNSEAVEYAPMKKEDYKSQIKCQWKIATVGKLFG